MHLELGTPITRHRCTMCKHCRCWCTRRSCTYSCCRRIRARGCESQNSRLKAVRDPNRSSRPTL
eukprot:3839902-Pleurochrysis_carterae.AAC.2